MNLSHRIVYSIALFIVTVLQSHNVCWSAEPIEWTGRGQHRVLVTVAPINNDARDWDERPAEIALDVSKLSSSGQAIDFASLQVVRYDPQTGKVMKYGKYAHGLSDADRPFRWYDGAIPYEFPEFADTIDRTKGKLKRKPTVRGGYFYNAIGDWKQGRLAWLHTQDGNQPSHYAIYFDFLPKGAKPTKAPPRGWIGDGLSRCAESGAPAIAADHCRMDVDDWNDDGLIDLITGEHYGHVFVWLNTGSKKTPEFTHHRFVVAAAGVPLDAGSGSAPKVVDWNGDGKKDLLIGAEWNRVLLYLNQGSNAERKLEYAGLLKVDGEDLKLPVTPLVRGSEQIFKRDYYPVLETADWDGDGDTDLLAGGYITGRIYFYENLGLENGLPKLALSEPLHADGKPINVGHWCAAPCAADLDGDGDLDLISGCLPTTMAPGDSIGNPEFLRYYENIGTRTKPKLRTSKLPANGRFPGPRLATPRPVDWDADGDIDLIVSARESIYLYQNKGSSTKPLFAAHDRTLSYPWGAKTIPADQFLDWNGDGRVDLFSRPHYSIRLNSGRGNPWSWDTEIPLLPAGKRIEHPTGTGDDWFWPFLDDINQDGHIDILFGDWHGNVWLHRNLAKKGKLEFDHQGRRLKLTDGNLIKVGPIGKDLEKDFDALQGARTTLTVADFNRDGRRDLVIGDTYGIVRYFRQTKSAGIGPFDPPVVVGNLGIRLLVDSTDWNNDGWPDIIAGAANGNVRVFLNKGKSNPGAFAEGFDPKLPPIPQPRVLMVDLNADGDEDLFLPSTQGSCFIERSFLTHGYARGKILRVERRDRN